MKTTKRAMLSSVIALFLCITMLMGTTYAWFTDSVTSENNVIKSGNLDVEFEYWKDGKWVDVAGKSDILTNSLWEPGVAEVAYLRVANAGSLALKYQLGINIVDEAAGVNAAGAQFKLSDYIQFGVVEGIGVDATTKAPTKYATREDAVAAVTAAKKISAGYTKASSMASGNELYLALVVWMPETVGNEANHDGKIIPKIDLGLNIFATQVANESDSFGPDYDEDAWHTEMKVYTAADLNAALANAEPGTTTTIVLEDDIELTSSLVIPAAATTFSRRSVSAVRLDLNGKTISNPNGYVIENQGNIIITGNGTMSGLGCIRSKGGSIVIENGNFYASSKWQDGVYQHTLKAENTVVTINGGNFDATVNGQTNAMFNASENGVITINGGTFKNVAGDLTQFDPYIFTYEKNGAVVINGGSFYGGWRFNGETTTTEINGGTFEVSFDGQSFHANSTHVVTVYGGTFAAGAKLTGKLSTIVADGFKAVETETDWMVIPENNNYVANGVQVSVDGTTYYISNRAGYAWMDAQADNFFGNKTIKLTADIDFGGETITGIKFWNSHPTVDGQGHTLSNFVIGHSGSKAPSGLFSGTFNVKNLVVDGANVTGDYAAAIAGNMYGNIDNCIVKNSVINCTYWQGGGLAAQYNNGNVTNSTVENCVISGGSAVGGLIGILNETAGERKVENCTVKDTEIVLKGGFGGNYDKYFGAAVGLINIENSKVYLNNCTVENTTVKGVASDVLYGEADSSTTVFIDGAKAVDTVEAFQAALNNATADTKLVFTRDITGDVTFTQTNGVSIEIDGNGKVMNGSINIIARADTSDKATIVIKGVNFKTADAERIFIYSNETNRYPNNVTVSGCTFEGTGADSNVVAINIKSANNFVIENCKATKVHSLLQNTSGWNLTVKDVEVTESGRGMALGTVQGVTLTNVTVKNAVKYGVRLDAGYNNNAVFTNCDISAFIPVVVRKVSVDSSMTFKGENTMTETNIDGIWLAIGTSEYEANGTLPTNAAKTVTVTLNDAGLATDGVCNNSGK